MTKTNSTLNSLAAIILLHQNKPILINLSKRINIRSMITDSVYIHLSRVCAVCFFATYPLGGEYRGVLFLSLFSLLFVFVYIWCHNLVVSITLSVTLSVILSVTLSVILSVIPPPSVAVLIIPDPHYLCYDLSTCLRNRVFPYPLFEQLSAH